MEALYRESLLQPGVGLAREAQHPNAALLFYDFMLTDAQKIYVGQETQPSNVTVKPAPEDAIYIDHAAALDQSEKWTRLFKETFGARGR
jgi:iron(III) transport system substrate-binding protein